MSFVPVVVAALLSTSGDAVVARVDQVTITRAAVSRRIELGARLRVTLTPAEALESLVNDALLAPQARQLGIDRSPELAAGIAREMSRAASNALVESYVARNVPEESALREMFHSTGDFVSYEFLAYASEQDARAARQRIEKGGSLAAEAPAAVVARLYPKGSDAPTAMRGELPGALAAALFAGKPGDLVGPTEGEKGWLLARVLSKQVGTDAEYAARRPALVQSYNKRTRDTTRSHLVQQLAAKAGVKIDEAFLRGLNAGEPTEQQLRHVVATVAGQPVRYADVYPKVASLGGQGGHMASPEVKVQLATSVVNDRLLESFAIERGFDKAPEVVDQLPEIERSLLAQSVVLRIHSGVPRPSRREVEDFYAKNAARYGQPLAQVRPSVEAAVMDEKRHDAVMARVAELRAKASVFLDAAALARTAR